MEHHRPDLSETILDLLRQLPEEVRRPVIEKLREMTSVLGTAVEHEVALPINVKVYPSTAEVQATAGSPTVELSGSIDVVAEIVGDLTVTPGSPTAPPGPLAWRKDLFVAAVVVFVILSFYDRSFTEGMADALRELCLILIALGVPAAALHRRR